MFLGPFTVNALCFRINATTTASAFQALPSRGETIRIVNEGPNTAYIYVGLGAIVATVPTGTPASTCTPVLANSDVTFSLADVAGQQISAITGTGTAVLDIQVGNGT